jgi:hypothetical protein
MHARLSRFAGLPPERIDATIEEFREQQLPELRWTPLSSRGTVGLAADLRLRADGASLLGPGGWRDADDDTSL